MIPNVEAPTGGGDGGGGGSSPPEPDVEETSSTSRDEPDVDVTDVGSTSNNDINLGQGGGPGFRTDGTSGADAVPDPTSESGQVVVTGGDPEERVDAIDEEVLPAISDRAQAAQSTVDEQLPDNLPTGWLPDGSLGVAAIGVGVAVVGGVLAGVGDG